jgi:predicted dehydrogenase
MLSVGVIGYRNHAARIIKIVNDLTYAQVEVIYYPYKLKNISKLTNIKEDLLSCDAVMILSPNSTHFEYLQWLSSSYLGYVFCEKPVVSNLKELNQLKLNPKRNYFNFNQRYGHIKKTISAGLLDGTLGKPLHLSLSVTQGLAYKSNYVGSWRAVEKHHMHGILETKAIHYIDLCNILFGNLKEYSYKPFKFSGKGETFDSCSISLHYQCGMTADLFFSYSSPYTNQMSFIGTNGTVEYTDSKTDVFSPRDSFDSNNMFIKPPSIYKKCFATENNNFYLSSLIESVNYFLTCINDNLDIDKNHFDTSIFTSKLIFEFMQSNSGKN